MLFLKTAIAVLSLSLASLAQSSVEGFTNGSNQGGWTWGAGDQFSPTGGNPEWHLETQILDTFAPQPRTAAGASSVFTGDYRARGVRSLGIDLVTVSTQFPFQRPLTLILENDRGTPGNPLDDQSVYFISSSFVPQPGTGWSAFDVGVPSLSLTMPAGWQVLQGAGAPNQVWNEVIGNVSRVRWFYGDPMLFFIFDIWQVGMDNARITTDLGTAFCFGDGSGTACPCSNVGGAGRGCANSAGAGGFLRAQGSSSLAANDLIVTVGDLPPGVTVLLYYGTAQANGGAGFQSADGLRCAGGSITRLSTRSAIGGAAQWGPGFLPPTTPAQSLHFQGWYRNPTGPCGLGWNFTNGRSIAITP